MIDAYVEGRPIPRCSNSLMSPASEYLPGGSVNFSSLFNSSNFSFSPALQIGNSISSPRAPVSTASQPGNNKREPVTVKSGIDPSSVLPLAGEEAKIFAVIFVFNNFASDICEDTTLSQMSL